MIEFDSEAKRVEDELMERHVEEYRKVNEELEKSLPFKPKESSEVLNLK